MANKGRGTLSSPLTQKVGPNKKGGNVPSTPILKHGWLEKQGKSPFGKKIQRRFAELYSGALVYYRGLSAAERKNRSLLELTPESVIAQDQNKPRILHVTPIPNGRIYQFTTESEPESKDWVEAMRGACGGEGALVDYQCPKGHYLVPFTCLSATRKCVNCQCVLAVGAPFFSCRSCEYDMCKSCMDRVLPKTDLRCPQGHALSCCRSPGPQWCALCQCGIATGASAACCHPCDFGVCKPCFSKPVEEPVYRDDGPTLGIFVKTFLQGNNQECVVVIAHMYAKSPVKDLMRVIRNTQSLAFPVEEQKLMFGNIVLDPQLHLEYYHIQAEDVIVVVHRVPIIPSTSVAEVLSQLQTGQIRLADSVLGCVAWSERKKEHYHIYWGGSSWSSRAQPTLTAAQKRTIQSTGAQNVNASTGNPQQPPPNIYQPRDELKTKAFSEPPKDIPKEMPRVYTTKPELTPQQEAAPSTLPVVLTGPAPTHPKEEVAKQHLVVSPNNLRPPASPVAAQDRSTTATGERSEPPKLVCLKEDVHWKRGKVLDAGASGKVFEALNLQTGALMAVKQVKINMENERSHALAAQLEREIATMSCLSHPNIVQMIGTEIQESKINILMEYVPGASLAKQLKQFGPFSEEHARKYSRQLVDALAYCHAAGVVHRDLKGANVLVTLSGAPKLADFGSAKKLADGDAKALLSEDFTYTTEWTAPEVFSHGEFNSKVDIWSLGCVVVEMLTGKTPWAEQKFVSREVAMYFIGSSTQLPALPKTLSATGQDFLGRCFKRKPEERATAKELLEHPWLQDQ